jgi:L-iditol 2-dehydrogenase
MDSEGVEDHAGRGLSPKARYARSGLRPLEVTAPMFAAMLHGPRDVRVDQVPEPVPTATVPLVRVTAVGLCGSDRHWYLEGGIGDAVVTRPIVLGHEIAGVVESGPRSGQRVAIDPTIACSACGPCRAGNPNLCVGQRFAGHGSDDGGLREFLTWPEGNLVDVPDSMPDEEAALVEPAAVALHALDLGLVRPGDVVGVFGCGPIGLLLIALLGPAGASAVAATDPLAHRTAAAGRLGAPAITTDGLGAPGEWESLTAGRAVDVAFETAGTDAAVDAAVAAVKPGGRVVLVGIPDGDRTTFRASVARRKGLSLVMVRRSRPADFGRVIAEIEHHHLALDPLVTHRYPLAQVADAFEALADRRGLKVVVSLGG